MLVELMDLMLYLALFSNYHFIISPLFHVFFEILNLEADHGKRVLVTHPQHLATGG